MKTTLVADSLRTGTRHSDLGHQPRRESAVGWYDDRVLPRIINKVLDNKHTREMRRRVAGGLSGEVLEIGFGSGLNLPYLPSSVTRLRAVDPSGQAAKLARERIEASSTPVEIVGL